MTNEQAADFGIYVIKDSLREFRRAKRGILRILKRMESGNMKDTDWNKFIVYSKIMEYERRFLLNHAWNYTMLDPMILRHAVKEAMRNVK